MENKQILIVDDDQNLRKTTSAILEDKGFPVTTAESGMQALECLQEMTPAVALVDLKLEDTSGIDIIAKIKSNNPATECIVITGYASQTTAIEAVNKGAYSYLQKPYDIDTLIITIQRALEKRKSRYELNRLADVVEQANESVVITDLDRNIIYVNQFFTRTTGYSAAEVIGKNVAILGNDEAGDEIRKEVWRTITSGKDWKGNLITNRKDGSTFNEGALIFPIKDEADTIINYAAVKRDITEQIKSETRIQQQLNRLKVLHKIDTSITSNIDLDTAMNFLLNQTINNLEVDAAGILLFDPQTQLLKYAAGNGFHTDLLQYTKLQLGEGYAGKAAEERQTITIPDLTESGVWVRKAPQFRDEKFIAYYGVPMVANEQLIGVLEVFQRTRHEHKTEWVEFLEILAGQAAIIINNSSLVVDLRKSHLDLEKSYNTTLEGWSRALEMRDKETKGHSERVTSAAIILARAMNIDSEELVHIRRGALLHDIGKMGISDTILQKPGPLSDEEWVIMREHPVYAYDLLSPIQYLQPALDIPLYHHEKWDGSGYPKGLKGQEIPLSARVFAIIDVWDALNSQRPYRPAWKEQEAKEHIQQQAGKHFDAKIVAKFIELLEDGAFN